MRDSTDTLMFKTIRICYRVGVLSGLLFAAMSLSCNVLRRSPPFTTVEPKKADLVGRWIPNASTLNEMRSKGGYSSSVKTSLVLHDDSTFELSNMPDWWTASGEPHGKFNQYSGNWSVSRMYSDFWHLNLATQWEARDVDLFGQNPPYRIAFRIGDPDDRQWMIFEKE